MLVSIRKHQIFRWMPVFFARPDKGSFQKIVVVIFAAKHILCVVMMMTVCQGLRCVQKCKIPVKAFALDSSSCWHLKLGTGIQDKTFVCSRSLNLSRQHKINDPSKHEGHLRQKDILTWLSSESDI